MKLLISGFVAIVLSTSVDTFAASRFPGILSRGINGISYWLGPTATFGNTDTAIRNWMYTPWGILCIFINKEITMGHQLILFNKVKSGNRWGYRFLMAEIG